MNTDTGKRGDEPGSQTVQADGSAMLAVVGASTANPAASDSMARGPSGVQTKVPATKQEGPKKRRGGKKGNLGIFRGPDRNRRRPLPEGDGRTGARLARVLISWAWSAP